MVLVAAMRQGTEEQRAKADGSLQRIALGDAGVKATLAAKLDSTTREDEKGIFVSCCTSIVDVHNLLRNLGGS